MASAGGDGGATGVLLAQAAGDYREWPAALPLRPHIQCVWHSVPRCPPSSAIAVLPDGCVDILWTAAGLVGLRFRPGVGASWLGVPATEIANSRVRLEELWGRRAARLAETLAESCNATEVGERLQAALL